MSSVVRGRQQDRSRISLQEEYEVRYWTEVLHVTEEELANAVREVGHSVESVREYFAQRK